MKNMTKEFIHEHFRNPLDEFQFIGDSEANALKLQGFDFITLKDPSAWRLNNSQNKHPDCISYNLWDF